MKMEKRGKIKPRGRSVFDVMAMVVLFLILAFMVGPRPAYAAPIMGPSVTSGAFTIFGSAQPVGIDTGLFGQVLVPLQLNDVAQLYAVHEGRGLPGAQTIFWRKGKFFASFGVAPVLGQSNNVPYFALQRMVNPRLLDQSSTNLHLGAFVGKPAHRELPGGERARVLWGLNISLGVS